MIAYGVKKKIWIGTLFLFFLLLITAGASIFYMTRLQLETKNVLRENYNSLEYCHSMQEQLDKLDLNYYQALQRFEAALVLQEHNVTEPGERVITGNLRSSFAAFSHGDTARLQVKKLEEHIRLILALNMKAIQTKTSRVEQTTTNALTVITIIGGLVFVIGFTFMVNFPGVVTTPISKLTEAIKEVANKNYRHRVQITNKDEFGTLANAFNEMAERLEYFESSNLNKLMFEKNRAEAVINSLKDASIGIDKNDIILFANEQALQLLNLHADSVVAQPVEQVRKTNELFDHILKNDQNTPFKVVIGNKENYFIKEQVEVAQGDTYNRVIVLKNITSFKELDTAKTNFIATISHELKTPLAASNFGLKLLEDERVTKLLPEQKELINNLKADNQRMLKILSELLNMSQVETGKIQLNKTRVSAGTILKNAVANVAADARQKGITITTDSFPDLPDFAADADKTTWIVTNLLTNAIKFSNAQGSVQVRAWSKGKNIHISVADEGSGIEKKYLGRLFDKYFQVPGSGEKGTGLGLAISKEFAEAQQGELTVESEPGKGSVFTLVLPLT